MSAFAVFATVLTIGYIIYYGFTVSRDIIANKKAEKNEVETFEVETTDEQRPTAVCETGDGFSIAPKIIEEEAVADEPRVISDDAPSFESESGGDTQAQATVKAVNEEMEPIKEASEPGFTPEEVDSLIKASLTNAMGVGPRILCNVVDETHGQAAPDSSDENAEQNDSREEIRL